MGWDVRSSGKGGDGVYFGDGAGADGAAEPAEAAHRFSEASSAVGGAARALCRAAAAAACVKPGARGGGSSAQYALAVACGAERADPQHVVATAAAAERGLSPSKHPSLPVARFVRGAVRPVARAVGTVHGLIQLPTARCVTTAAGHGLRRPGTADPPHFCQPSPPTTPRPSAHVALAHNRHLTAPAPVLR